MVNQKQLKTIFIRIKYKDKVGYIAVNLKSNLYTLDKCIAQAENIRYFASLFLININIIKLGTKLYNPQGFNVA